jgi:multiple sugar transport system substrate-binding protein
VRAGVRRSGHGRGYARRPGLATVLALTAAAAVLAGCDSTSSSSSSARPPPSSSAPTSATTLPSQLPPQNLTFGVVGGPDEVAAYEQMATLFAPLNRQVTVKVESWPSAGAMVEGFEAGAKVPDVFLVSRRYLPWMLQNQAIQPIDQLLDERGVDFGDSYPRGTLTAWAVDNRLTCLPYGIEPTVMLYNTHLVKLARIPDPATPGQGWSFDQFASAARWAVRNRPGTTGMYLDPTIGGLSPFLYSGEGQLFDNDADPTSTAFATDPNRQTLTRLTRAMRRPHMTLTADQLAEKTALEWFEEGELAFLEGNRHMVPGLRQHARLDFDVMPMPRIGRSATSGTLTGLCISGSPRDVSTAADFLVYASSPDALGLVASAGYLQPANQTVALSDDFQQPGHLPRHAGVFTFSVKSMVYPPLLSQWDDLDAVVDPRLATLLAGDPADVPRHARRADRASRPVLATGQSPSASPSG